MASNLEIIFTSKSEAIQTEEMYHLKTGVLLNLSLFLVGDHLFVALVNTLLSKTVRLYQLYMKKIQYLTCI